ncbi:MAG: heme transporter HemC, partial [Caulobacteraceae bacterium]
WWHSLHQGESIFLPGGPVIATVFLVPLALMSFGYLFAFGGLWLVRTRGEVWRRRAQSLAVQAAGR